MAGKSQNNAANSEDTLTLDLPSIEKVAAQPSLKVEKEEPIVAANVVLKLSEEFRRGATNVDGEDYVYDPKTNKQRKARLLKGVPSIWADDQEKLDKNYVDRNKRSLEFSSGRCIIPAHDKSAIEFATVCNSNMDNPNKFGVKPIYFSVWNPMAEAAKQNKVQMDMLSAMQIAATMEAEKMYRHAVYLGVPLADEMGNRATESAIRNLYMLKANTDPSKFLASVENPAVELSWAVKTLIANGTIDLSKQAGQAYWNDGGYITTIPAGENPKDYLLQYALVDGEANRNFKAQLKALVN